MKNYVKEGQKLPIFGIGPYMITGMGVVGLAGILLSGNVLKSGIVHGAAGWAFRLIGIVLILLGAAIWYIGAVRSGMDEAIENNKLKTNGIYAWVRNPMYSGWWLLITGIVLQWHNLWLLLVFPINWAIMTVVLKHTEEKWLKDLYGQEYMDYCKQVNRCIPWKRN